MIRHVYHAFSSLRPRRNFNPRKKIGWFRALLVTTAVFLASSHPGFAQSLRPEDIYQKVLPSVMTLRVENARGETYVGTAFLALDKNVAVTAWHVVSDAVTVSAKFSNNRIVSVDGLIDKDEQHDLALIHLNAGDRPEARLCVTEPPIGSRAYVIGAPKGFDFSITDGLISQIQRIRGADQYQVSCPISGGDSGGPVVNERGEVLGIAAWTQKDAQNLSFAIPAGFLDGLNAKRPITRWMDSTRTGAKPSIAPPDAVKTSEPQGDLPELKRLLKTSAGRRVAITVSDGENSKRFDLVVPKDFVR